MKPPVVILIRPQMGENIGAAARAMANFGLCDLRVVAPRDGWPNPKAEEMAANALPIVKNAKIFDDIKGATQDINRIFAVTARLRDMVKDSFSSVQLHDRLANAGGKVAFMFGPERSGLDNDEVAMADAVVTIPVDPQCPSLNLGHAVAVLAYEWCRGGGDYVVKKDYEDGNQLASKAEIIDFLEQLERALDDSGHFRIQDKRPKMLQNIQNIFTRMPLVEQEVRSLRGIIKSLVGRKKREKQK